MVCLSSGDGWPTGKLHLLIKLLNEVLVGRPVPYLAGIDHGQIYDMTTDSSHRVIMGKILLAL